MMDRLSAYVNTLTLHIPSEQRAHVESGRMLSNLELPQNFDSCVAGVGDARRLIDVGHQFVITDFRKAYVCSQSP